MTEYPLDASCDMVHNESREHFGTKSVLLMCETARDVHPPARRARWSACGVFGGGDGETSPKGRA